MSLPGLPILVGPTFTLAEWNNEAESTHQTQLAQTAVIIATTKPGLLQFPSVQYLYSAWKTLDAVTQQAKADMVGGVGITNG